MNGKKIASISPDKQNDAVVLRKFLLVLGLVFPLIGSASADAKLKPDEYVMFLPDIAYQAEDGSILAGVQGWVYEKEPRRGMTRLLALFLGIEMSKLSPPMRRQLYERTQLFRVDSEGGKQLTLDDGTGRFFSLPKTRSNGRTSALIEMKQKGPKKLLEIILNLHDSGMPAAADQAHAFYAPPTGISIISDIDDTIKESSVGDTKQLLIKTFLEDFIAVKGMSAWYNTMNKKGDIAFHYVSSSPIQLYPILLDFMANEGYPRGTMHLREATRWTDIIPGPKASFNHKKRSIERILNAYPKRQFILIGDSSESDALIYADFMRRYPEQVCAIVIRDVKPTKQSLSYETIFSGLDTKQWLVTSSPEMMQKFVSNLCRI